MKDGLSVVLNIYKINEGTVSDAFGIRLYHTAIEYDGTEFAFGYFDNPNFLNSTGVYDITPMTFENGVFVESIKIGFATRRKFFNILEKIKINFKGLSYNLLTKNCNHFTNDVLKELFDKQLPSKYSMFLSIGEFFRKIF